MSYEKKQQDLASKRESIADTSKTTATQAQHKDRPRGCCKYQRDATSSTRTDVDREMGVECLPDFKVEKRRKKTKLRHSFGLGRFLFQSPEKEPWCPIRKYCEARKQTRKIKLKAKRPPVEKENRDLERITTGISKL